MHILLSVCGKHTTVPQGGRDNSTRQSNEDKKPETSAGPLPGPEPNRYVHEVTEFADEDSALAEEDMSDCAEA